MSIKDVIKTSVYQQLGSTTNMSAYKIVLLLLASILIGIYIWGVYRNQSKSAFYSRDLNLTIAGLPIVVCAIMIAMQSNLIVSLGMVGALSIVRFRNAIKNPLDLLYCFWAVSAGIICGVGLILLVVLLCVVMTVLIVFSSFIPNAKASSVLVLRSSKENFEYLAVTETIKKNASYVKEKSRSIVGTDTEIIYELTTKDENRLLKEIKEKHKFIDSISFLSHDGEYRI